MPIPAAIGALAALAGSVISNKFASNAQERSIAAQRGLQNDLINGGAQMARNAKQAGLSPAFALGSASTPTAPAVASNFSPVDTSGFQSLLGGISQRKLQKQQEKVAKANEQTQLASARATTADARIKEQQALQETIKTQNMIGRANTFNNSAIQYKDPSNGKIIPNLDEWSKLNPNVVPEMVVPSGQEGVYEARNLMGEYVTLHDERLSRSAKAKFEKALNDAKLSQEDYIDIVLAMDREQLNDIRATIRNKGLQAAYQQLINKQTEDSSMGHLLDKLGNPDMNWFDKLMAVIAWLGNNISLSARLK